MDTYLIIFAFLCEITKLNWGTGMRPEERDEKYIQHLQYL